MLPHNFCSVRLSPNPPWIQDPPNLFNEFKNMERVRCASQASLASDSELFSKKSNHRGSVLRKIV